jgi:hypothetical protein
MRVNKKDKNLLLALKDIQSVEARRHVIDHLGKVPAKRLAAHLKGLILQQPGYKVRGSEDRLRSRRTGKICSVSYEAARALQAATAAAKEAALIIAA